MSNLPPGVTVDMLPSNTPEDEASEELLDELESAIRQIFSEWDHPTHNVIDQHATLLALLGRFG